MTHSLQFVSKGAQWRSAFVSRFREWDEDKDRLHTEKNDNVWCTRGSANIRGPM